MGGRLRQDTGLCCRAVTEQTTWLTPEAHRKLTEELAYLEAEGRAKAAERLADARSHGDIRENSDYEAAQEEQGLLEARIRQLKTVLGTAEVRMPPDTGRVEVGSVVTVTDTEGQAMELLVAAAENRVPGYVLASPYSPIGQAILGTRVGDEVTYEAPGGTFRVTVTDIRPFRP